MRRITYQSLALRYFSRSSSGNPQYTVSYAKCDPYESKGKPLKRSEIEPLMSRGVFKELWKLSPDATRLIGTMRFETALTTAKALQIVNNIAVNNGHFPASIKVDYNRFEVQVEMFTIALGGISYNDLHMATMMEASLQLLEPMKEHHDQGSL